jgi:hypothetical protein
VTLFRFTVDSALESALLLFVIGIVATVAY